VTFSAVKMPTYEMAVLFRIMPKEKLTEALKKTASLIFQEGGIVRKLNNLGTQQTPYKISKHGQVHKQASCFVYEFDFPASSVQKLKDELNKHEIIVRQRVYQPVVPINPEECKIEEEMQIAPFRKEVQDMLKIAEKERAKLQRGKVKPNHGLDFDPFPL